LEQWLALGKKEITFGKKITLAKISQTLKEGSRLEKWIMLEKHPTWKKSHFQKVVIVILVKMGLTQKNKSHLENMSHRVGY